MHSRPTIPVQSLSPTFSRQSTTQTEWPKDAKRCAAKFPAGPAPTTITSYRKKCLSRDCAPEQNCGALMVSYGKLVPQPLLPRNTEWSPYAAKMNLLYSAISSITFGCHDEIVLVQPFDLVGVENHVAIAPAETDVRSGE
mgnify:CR=1 FL=1